MPAFSHSGLPIPHPPSTLKNMGSTQSSAHTHTDSNTNLHEQAQQGTAPTATATAAPAIQQPQTLRQPQPKGNAAMNHDLGPDGTDRKSAKIGIAVIAALVANILVALVKFAVFLFTRSASMLSESVHSLADSGNELTLILGNKLSHRPPSRKHPLGWSRARYLASFIVAVSLFAIGGVYSASESIAKIRAVASGGPEAHAVDTSKMSVVLVVTLVCALIELWSLHNGIKEAKERFAETHNPGRFSLWKFWRGTKSSDIAVVLAEDTLAVIGLAFAFIGTAVAIATGDVIWDAIGGTSIGVLLIIGALLLGWQVASLLIGEGASEHTYQIISTVLARNPDVERVLADPAAIHLSEKRILVLLKVQFRNETELDDTVAINRLEEQLRAAIPYYTLDIVVEPDAYDPAKAAKVEDWVD